MQLRNTASDEKHPTYSQETMEYYLQKTYLKSASLISKSTRAAAILGNCSPDVVEAAYSYGKNLGLAFQLVDDMLDYTVSGAELGKPAGADLELGLATAPLLFAWKDNKELGTLVGRRFAEEGDVKRVSLRNLQPNMQIILTTGRHMTLSLRATASNKLAPWLKTTSTRLAKPLLSSRRVRPRPASWTCVQKFCRGGSRHIYKRILFVCYVGGRKMYFYPSVHVSTRRSHHLSSDNFSHSNLLPELERQHHADGRINTPGIWQMCTLTYQITDYRTLTIVDIYRNKGRLV